jgi:nitrate reductase delta subunit
MIYWLVEVVGVLVSLFWLRARHAERKKLQARSKSLQEKYLGGYRQPRVSFFDHESHQILLLDLTYCTPQEVVQGLQEFQEILSNQPAYSILTIIDLTDGRFTPEAIEQMKLVISGSRRYLARVAFMGHRTLLRKDRSPILKFFLRRYPFFGNKDDAMDFVEHDDQYPLYYPVEFKPGTLTADGSYNWALLYELFSRLLRYPDDEYWTTTQCCLAFFAHARTKKLRLLTAFSDEIRNLSTEQLQTLYTETFGLDPACSLEMSSQLRGTAERRELIGWMERQLRERGVELPTPSLPPDHISTGLLLLSRLASAMGEDFVGGSLSPAIENLIRALKGRNNPFERLLTVLVLALDPGGDLYALPPE